MAESCSGATKRESDLDPPASVDPGPPACSTSSMPGLPSVVKFVSEFSVQHGKWTARCKQCKKMLTNKEGTTTPFTK